MTPTILALDLEGTLISNAVSQIPRPGLYQFLEDVRSQFEELVLFTTVPENLARRIADVLISEGSAPAWFAGLRYIDWSGKTKDLFYVSDRLGDALLLDDYRPYVHVGQEHLWIEIPLFGSPYSPEDDALHQAFDRVKSRVRQIQAHDAPQETTGEQPL
ncbi:NIF family HAD-type phosphatase [Nocardiopsis yanglingensis]